MFDNNISDISQGIKGMYEQLAYRGGRKSAKKEDQIISVPLHELYFGENDIAGKEEAMSRKELISNVLKASTSRDATAYNWKGDDDFLQTQFKILHEFEKIKKAYKLMKKSIMDLGKLLMLSDKRTNKNEKAVKGFLI